MSDEPQTEDPMVAALLREREGLKQRGLDDRVTQVDEQLKFHGYRPRRAAAKEQTPPTPPTPPVPPADPEAAAPKGRQQQTPQKT
ncbi:hypothetical protein ACFY84_29970 [Streptomyces sp. NPDC012438]|uniref:hypothetical protein n=1 Tax=Streptomyces sp. NPDC012438 TaxID=3364833 RepID=UPI0036ED2EDB